MAIDFRASQRATSFSGLRVIALSTAFALHLCLWILISLPATVLPHRQRAYDYRGALLVELSSNRRKTILPTPIAISFNSGTNLPTRQFTADIHRKIILPTPKIRTAIKPNLAAPTVRLPSIISLIASRAIRLPPGETWAERLPGSRFVPGSSRVIAHGFHFEPPGSNTLGGKVHLAMEALRGMLFCSQIGLYANLPAAERDRHGLTAHELHLIQAEHYCN